jgi:hypothetical protein
MNNSTSDISIQRGGFDIGSTIFFLKKVGVSLHAANTEHKKKFFSYLFGISALENNTEHLTSFLKIFRSPTDLGSAQALWQTPPGAVHSSVVQTRPDAAQASVV